MRMEENDVNRVGHMEKVLTVLQTKGKTIQNIISFLSKRICSKMIYSDLQISCYY